jgi:hypothetical protein
MTFVKNHPFSPNCRDYFDIYQWKTTSDLLVIVCLVSFVFQYCSKYSHSIVRLFPTCPRDLVVIVCLVTFVFQYARPRKTGYRTSVYIYPQYHLIYLVVKNCSHQLSSSFPHLPMISTISWALLQSKVSYILLADTRKSQ